MILDAETASMATGVPLRTIQRWVRDGRLVDHGDNRRILVDPDEVMELSDLRDTRSNHRLPKQSGVA